MLSVIGATRTRTLRVLWMLEELGLDYEHVPSPPRAADVSALNPLGRVPLLRDGDAVLTDSVAIMTYLGDRHPHRHPDDGTGGLSHPPGTVERAHQDALAMRILDEFDALLWTKARHSFVLPEKLRVPEVIPVLDKELARNAGRLAETLGGRPFLMGDRMTIPDILTCHCCGWAAKTGVAMDTDPRLGAYLERLRSRPAYLRALRGGKPR